MPIVRKSLQPLQEGTHNLPDASERKPPRQSRAIIFGRLMQLMLMQGHNNNRKDHSPLVPRFRGMLLRNAARATRAAR